MQSHENVSSHLVKCVMKRESAPARPKAVKYTLRLGDKMSNSAFMMAALQGSRCVRHAKHVVLRQACQQLPQAQLFQVFFSISKSSCSRLKHALVLQSLLSVSA